jgi:hypothetical protein
LIELNKKMSDDAIRHIGRAAALSGSPDDEARALRTRVRSGEAIYDRDLPLLRVTEGARASVMETLEHARIPEEERVLLLLRGLHAQYLLEHSRRMPAAPIQETIVQVHQSVVELLTTVDLGPVDAAFPTEQQVIDAIFTYLETHPQDLEAIHNMKQPALSIMPSIYNGQIMAWGLFIVDGPGVVEDPSLVVGIRLGHT